MSGSFQPRDFDSTDYDKTLVPKVLSGKDGKVIPGTAEARYNRAADKRLLIKWLVAIAVIALVGLGSTLYSKSMFDAAKHDREMVVDGNPSGVESAYSDRVESKYDMDYDRAPYKEIARTVEKDGVWIDDYYAFEIDDDDLAAIKDEIKDDSSGIPVFVAFVDESDYDDVDGDLDLFAGRIARELSARPATVAVIGQNRDTSVTVGGIRDYIYSDSYSSDLDAQYESKNALSYIKALNAGKADVADSQGRAGDISSDAPVVAEPDEYADASPLYYSALSWVFGIVFGVAIGFLLTGLTKLLLRIITNR